MPSVKSAMTWNFSRWLRRSMRSYAIQMIRNAKLLRAALISNTLVPYLLIGRCIIPSCLSRRANNLTVAKNTVASSQTICLWFSLDDLSRIRKKLLFHGNPLISFIYRDCKRKNDLRMIPSTSVFIRNDGKTIPNSNIAVISLTFIFVFNSRKRKQPRATFSRSTSCKQCAISCSGSLCNRRE